MIIATEKESSCTVISAYLYFCVLAHVCERERESP
jgi:hypothetical protein